MCTIGAHGSVNFRKQRARRKRRQELVRKEENASPHLQIRYRIDEDGNLVDRREVIVRGVPELKPKATSRISKRKLKDQRHRRGKGKRTLTESCKEQIRRHLAKVQAKPGNPPAPSDPTTPSLPNGTKPPWT